MIASEVKFKCYYHWNKGCGAPYKSSCVKIYKSSFVKIYKSSFVKYINTVL